MLKTFQKCLALSVFASLPALPAILSYNGDTTGDPVWNRPSPNANIAPIALDGTVTAVAYESFQFTVDQTGGYVIQSTQTGFDGVIFLYQNAFNAATPLVNVLIGDDDADATCSGGSNVIGFSCLPGNPSGGTVNLTAGTTYFVVTTGFNNQQAGAYTNTISGPGNINGEGTVPEPSTVALMFSGVAVVALARRRKR